MKELENVLASNGIETIEPESPFIMLGSEYPTGIALAVVSNGKTIRFQQDLEDVLF